MMDVDVIFSTAALQAIRLTVESAAALQDLLKRGADYFEMVDGRPPLEDAAVRELTEMPPGHPVENLFGLGLRAADGALAGVIIALRHYPQQNQWYIGLLLLDPSWRGRQVGRECYAAFETWVRGSNAETIQLAVVEANERGAMFWNSLGFHLARRHPAYRSGLKEHVLLEFEKKLTDG